MSFEKALRHPLKRFRFCLLVWTLLFAPHEMSGFAQTPEAPKAGQQQAVTERDGQHDFDFLFGTWKFHLKRLMRPLSGSTEWVQFDGTAVARKIWDGRANLDELNLDNLETHKHVHSTTVRFYNPQSHQWSIFGSNGTDPSLLLPATVGHFTNGRGEFYDQEDYQGKPILVRFVWSDITANSAHFEQSFSADWGKTWEANWITDQTRDNAPASKAIDTQENPPAQSKTGNTQENASDKRDGQHDFDFLVGGTWNFHLKRLVRPLTGSTEWVEFDGTTVCRKIGDGPADLEELNLESPEKHVHLQGMALRFYNPQSHQWSIYWVNATKGSVDLPPMVGQFTGDRGEFYNQDVYEGRAIFTRFIWSNVTGKSPHFEQSYSVDGGKTWEVNWVTDETRQP